MTATSIVVEHLPARGRFQARVDGRLCVADYRRSALAAASEFAVAKQAGLVGDEVLGFRRFYESEFSADLPPTLLRCERYLAGAFRRGAEVWPVFSVATTLVAALVFSSMAKFCVMVVFWTKVKGPAVALSKPSLSMR